MPELLLLSAVRPALLAALEDSYTIHKFYEESDQPGFLADHAAKIEGVVTGGHIGIPPDLMAALPGLRIIGINGVGYDRVDLEAARARGIRVTNTPDVLTADVADLAVGLTIALLRRLPQAHAHVTAGKWPSAEMPLTRKVSGKRFGIMGMGRIGQAVAKRLAAFDGVIGYMANSDKQGGYTRYPSVEALAASSDVLVVCAAASAATRRIVGRAVFDALGPNGALVNIARGSIIDEPELVRALQDGRLGGAALDVFESEPNVPPALLALENVVLTPHVASATDETRTAMGQLMMDNLAAYFAGRPLPTPVV
jgi:lactate dehydrogenase-like 2-hydroxyacid dehydrogenase